MDKGTEVTLTSAAPRPEEWEVAEDSHYYEHVMSERRITEESYYAKVRRRNILAQYLDEVAPVQDEVPSHL